jgi:hypothetical protein
MRGDFECAFAVFFFRIDRLHDGPMRPDVFGMLLQCRQDGVKLMVGSDVAVAFDFREPEAHF